MWIGIKIIGVNKSDDLGCHSFLLSKAFFQVLKSFCLFSVPSSILMMLKIAHEMLSIFCFSVLVLNAEVSNLY